MFFYNFVLYTILYKVYNSIEKNYIKKIIEKNYIKNQTIIEKTIKKIMENQNYIKPKIIENKLYIKKTGTKDALV